MVRIRTAVLCAYNSVRQLRGYALIAASLSVFYPPFIDPGCPTVGRVADHIEHIANMVGKDHVGIASDFDGMYASVRGLEDASEYPNLVSHVTIQSNAPKLTPHRSWNCFLEDGQMRKSSASWAETS